MTKKRNPVLDYLVYSVVRLMVAVLQILPMDYGRALARTLASLAYAVDKRHRKTAEENLRHAFGDRLSPEQRRRMVHAVYEHFLRLAVEIAHIPRKMNISNYKLYSRLENIGPGVRALLDETRPTLCVTGHFGNWEMAGFLMAAIGVRSFTIARDLDNPYLDRFLRRFREYSGQTMLSKNGDFQRIRNVLAQKKVLVSVGDQSAGPRGYFVDFFGRPASTHRAIALLSLEYDAPLFIGYAFRDQPGFHYTITCGAVLDPRDFADRPNPLFELTQAFTTQLEQAIRRKPEQYLWLHHRWKHAPPKRRSTTAA